MPHSFKPTPEQHAVVDAVLGGGHLKIKAYAGAGKTSTLRLIADRLPGKRGSYLAFNKEIAQHARRGFPPNVSARTVHSLAYASVAPALTARVNLPAEPPHEFNVTKPAQGWRPTASRLLSPRNQPPNEYPDAQGHPGCRPWTLMHITVRQLR